MHAIEKILILEILFLTPKFPRDRRWPIFAGGFYFEWELWLFLDGGEMSIRIDEFHFASNALNLIGFGLNPQPCGIFWSHPTPQISLDVD